jgi:Sperm-tail PG-rich repeat
VSPGPGHYNAHLVLEGQEKVKLGVINPAPSNIAHPLPSPGPGHYEEVRDLHKKAKMGLINPLSSSGYKGYSTALGESLYHSEIPVKSPTKPNSFVWREQKLGPGSYDAKEVMSKSSIKFNKAERFEKKKNDGPGYYDIPHSIPDVADYNYPKVEDRKIKLN